MMCVILLQSYERHFVVLKSVGSALKRLVSQHPRDNNVSKARQHKTKCKFDEGTRGEGEGRERGGGGG